MANEKPVIDYGITMATLRTMEKQLMGNSEPDSGYIYFCPECHTWGKSKHVHLVVETKKS